MQVLEHLPSFGTVEWEGSDLASAANQHGHSQLHWSSKYRSKVAKLTRSQKCTGVPSQKFTKIRKNQKNPEQHQEKILGTCGVHGWPLLVVSYVILLLHHFYVTENQ